MVLNYPVRRFEMEYYLPRALTQESRGYMPCCRHGQIVLNSGRLNNSQEQYPEDSRLQAEDYLAVIERAAQEAGVTCDTVTVSASHAYEAIIQAAEQRGCDLILMASHGRKGMQGLLIGSETAKVLTHTKLPISSPACLSCRAMPSGSRSQPIRSAAWIIASYILQLGPMRYLQSPASVPYVSSRKIVLRLECRNPQQYCSRGISASLDLIPVSVAATRHISP